MTHEGARDLLEATHLFPGTYTIKAIGRSERGFVERVVQAAQTGLSRPGDVHYSIRETPHGDHVAVTLELSVLSPDEVIEVYRALQVLHGLKVLL